MAIEASVTPMKTNGLVKVKALPAPQANVKPTEAIQL
jgi:hypothetical protein